MANLALQHLPTRTFYHPLQIAVQNPFNIASQCTSLGVRQVPAGAAYSHLAWGPTGQLAAACDNSIHFLDSSTGGIIDTVEGAHEAAISSLEWAPKLLIAGAAP